MNADDRLHAGGIGQGQEKLALADLDAFGNLGVVAAVGHGAVNHHAVGRGFYAAGGQLLLQPLEAALDDDQGLSAGVEIGFTPGKVTEVFALGAVDALFALGERALSAGQIHLVRVFGEHLEGGFGLGERVPGGQDIQIGLLHIRLG